jgi:two-component system C4-dicarboxylate transport sensor histidine kinase DctB
MRENLLRNGRFLRLLLGFVAAAGIFFLVGEKWAQSTADTVAEADGQQLATSNALLFNSELQKFRLLPIALAEYPDVSELLLGGPTSHPVNDRLERLATETNAAAIYVIRPDGRTVAASNYRLPTSFVGQNYAFRPYFRDALRHGNAEVFALGTVSGRPGFYLARRVGDASRPLGVIVVKIEFDMLQSQWKAQAGTTMVADDHGIVIISEKKEWRFRSLHPLEPTERSEIIKNRLFEGFKLAALPFDVALPKLKIDGIKYRVIREQIALSGGSLIVLMPTASAVANARAQALMIVVSLLSVLFGILVWQFRQLEKAENQLAVQRELEKKVSERTLELEEANAKLVLESAERANSEERYRRSREELAQANRLGTLGQITAGVAHEINQPIAAIRAFAENAATYLDRGKEEKTQENLKHIIKSTERVAAITSELRNFSRKKTPQIETISLSAAIDAALLLVRHRTSGSKTSINWSRADASIAVRADRIRLEQVFVNLIQNSLDALDGSSGGEINIDVKREAGSTIVSFSDNGPGFDKATEAKIFTPFTTGKEHGLGLGLAIVRDIVREFGGEIALIDGSRAQFEIRFAKA